MNSAGADLFGVRRHGRNGARPPHDAKSVRKLMYPPLAEVLALAARLEEARETPSKAIGIDERRGATAVAERTRKVIRAFDAA